MKVRNAVAAVVGGTSGLPHRVARTALRASTDPNAFHVDNNAKVRPHKWTRSAWVADAATLTFCVILLVRDLTVMHADRVAALIAGTAFTLTALASVTAAAAGAAALRLMPLLAAMMVIGMVRANSAQLVVAAFAAAALVPVAAVWSAGKTLRWLAAPLVCISFATALVRLVYRDPFRELRCAPACVQNPWLRVHSADLVRNTERALAIVTLLWVTAMVVALVRRRHPLDAAALSGVVVIVVAGAWAVRLIQQPRPLPGDAVDRRLTLILLGAVVFIAGLRSIAPVETLAVRRRVRRFATSLSNASDMDAIAAHLRHVTRDPTIDIELGAGTSGGTSPVTGVRRGQHVVATIHHAAAARGRVAAGVTPATALALETQLMLQQASDQLIQLKASRARAVLAADEARRRLERDLHDGAQQRLLVVGMQLANAGNSSLNAAAVHVAAALADLRRLGRGDAAIVAELGLRDAVTEVTGTAPVPMRVTSTQCDTPAHDCWPQDVATTAYRLVLAAVAAAQRSGAKEVTVELCCCGDGSGRTVSTWHDGQMSVDRSTDQDRVLAVSGRITIDDGLTFVAWLP